MHGSPFCYAKLEIMNRTILVVEDDPDIAKLITMHVEEAGYTSIHVDNGEQGLEKFEQCSPDLVVLDIMLPGMNGLEVCKYIRKQNERVPVLMLTAKSTELDRVLGLELGADDYLTKPFSVVELMARVKALFRRVDALSEAPAKVGLSSSLDFGDLRIDAARHKVETPGGGVDLTAREFDLLLYLASSPGHVFSRAQLLDAVWGYDHDGYEHTVNTHINRLRIKIEPDPGNPRYVQTVWGVGYKFNES
jgi:two-component system OmpR family response regulator